MLCPAAHSAGIASIPESQALLQNLNAAAAAARLGLDSSLDFHSASNASYHGGQNLDSGPRRCVFTLECTFKAVDW